MAYSGAFGKQPPEEEAVTSPGGEEEKAGPTPARRPPRGGGPLPDLGTLLKKTEAAGMETDDLLMALVLYLMYRESGDTDLLIMLGVMLLT